jgi:hypothetical protein
MQAEAGRRKKEEFLGFFPWVPEIGIMKNRYAFLLTSDKIVASVTGTDKGAVASLMLGGLTGLWLKERREKEKGRRILTAGEIDLEKVLKEDPRNFSVLYDEIDSVTISKRDITHIVIRTKTGTRRHFCTDKKEFEYVKETFQHVLGDKLKEKGRFGPQWRI